MFNFGILGMNARNLLYIKKFNNKKSIRLANNKLQTKNFLAERGIPFAQTFGVIKNRKELFDFNFSILPQKNFVIKPNKGSKGEGILIVKYIGENDKIKKTDNIGFWKKFNNFLNGIDNINNFNHLYKIGDNVIDDISLRMYLVDIIDGKYSMTLGNDKIIVEQKLIGGEGFKEFCEFGLADIRIIVFNLVPVAAMIRVPTKKSGGKANLAAGGIGFGIDVASGKIHTMVYKKKIWKNKFPGKYSEFWNKKIPYRDDILFLSSKVQYYVNLGYLALDRVITNDGPKLLEINARAGLEVQNVSGIKLGNILNKISDLKIEDPEKGVEISKTLFSKETHTTSKILFLSQYGNLKLQIDEENEKKYDMIVEIDLNKKGNYVSSTIIDDIKSNPKTKLVLNLPDNDIVIRDLKLLKGENINEKKMILGSKISSNYLIKPIHKTFDTINIINEKKLIQKEKGLLVNVDQKIETISRRLSLSNILRPRNYFNERDNFILMKYKYNPKFIYNWPDDKKLENINLELNKMKKILENDEIKSKLKILFMEKIDELDNRLKLIESYKNQDYENILKYNQTLFGKIDQSLVNISKQKSFDTQNDLSLLGKKLSMSEVEEFIEKYLIENKFYGIDINFSSRIGSRIAVVMGKNVRIEISKTGIFRENELLSILAHEVNTHLLRYINGVKSGWKIFKVGTGYYRKDEEGLAVHNAIKYLPEEYQKISIYKEYFLINESGKYNFSKLFDVIKFVYPWRDNEKIFKLAIKIKKGINNTGIVDNGTVFYKNKIYLDGYLKIKDWIDNGGDESKLYRGKIKLEDLDFIV